MNRLIARHGCLPAFLERFRNGVPPERRPEPTRSMAGLRESTATFTLDLSAPGFTLTNVSVDVNEGFMTITAGREADREEKAGGSRRLRREFHVPSFSRSFMLPANVDAENMVGTLNNEVLTLTLPKKKDASENKKLKIVIGA